MGWEKKKFKIEMPEVMTSVLDTATEAMGAMGDMLITIKSLASIVSLFVTGFANPVLAALQFILGEMITVIRALKNSGIHMITITANANTGHEIKIRDIWPQAEIEETLDSLKFAQELREVEVAASVAHDKMVAEFKKGKNRNDVLFKKLVKDLTDAEAAVRKKKTDIALIRSQRNKLGQDSTWLMTADEAINAYLKSFTDGGDINRPLYDETTNKMLPEDQMILGGLVLLTGCTGNVDEFILQYVKIVKLFADLLNIGEFYNEYHKFSKLLSDALEVDTDKKSLSYKLGKKVAPDWDKKILYSELVPQFGDVLGKVENWLTGFQSSVATTSDAFDSVLDFLDGKISEIDKVVKSIEEFTTWYEGLKSVAEDLHSISTFALYVPPAKNGISELKRLVASTSDPNSPLYSELKSYEQIAHCAMFSIVGTGPSMSMMAAILGFPVDFLEGLGVDDTLAIDSRVMKEKFGLDDTYFD